MIVCSIHEGKELNKRTKNKNIPYHWIEEGSSDFSNMCYGRDKPAQTETKTTDPKADPYKMTKEEWEEKEQRTSQRFDVRLQRELRSNLATSALRELIIHSEGKLNHQTTLNNLYYWVWNGTWKGTEVDKDREMAEAADEFVGDEGE